MCDYPKARRLVVYHDAFDDLRAWMEELHIEEDVSDPPGALMPLLESVETGTLTGRIGPDRMEAFVTKLRQEEIELLRRAARLGRHGGLKYENVAMLEQAHRTRPKPTRRRNAFSRSGAAPRPRRPTIPIVNDRAPRTPAVVWRGKLTHDGPREGPANRCR